MTHYLPCIIHILLFPGSPKSHYFDTPKPLGDTWGAFGGSLSALSHHLGAPWVPLGVTLASMGSPLVSLGLHMGTNRTSPGPKWVPFGCHLGTIA